MAKGLKDLVKAKEVDEQEGKEVALNQESLLKLDTVMKTALKTFGKRIEIAKDEDATDEDIELARKRSFAVMETLQQTYELAEIHEIIQTRQHDIKELTKINAVKSLLNTFVEVGKTQEKSILFLASRQAEFMDKIAAGGALTDEEFTQFGSIQGMISSMAEDAAKTATGLHKLLEAHSKSRGKRWGTKATPEFTPITKKIETKGDNEDEPPEALPMTPEEIKDFEQQKSGKRKKKKAGE